MDTNWQCQGSNTICSKTCQALHSGAGCASGSVGDVVETTVDGTSEIVTASTCLGLTLTPGFYCCDKNGIYLPLGSTPVAGSYAAASALGWMIADSANSGHGSFFENIYGPIPWTMTCC